MLIPSRPGPRRGLLLIALASMTWGTTGSVTALLVERADATPLLIGAARLWIGAALLVAATAAAGLLRVHPNDRARCLLMGACMAAFQASYFTAVTLSGIAITALIAICSAPLLIAALARALLGERLSTRGAAALGLGVIGTALLIIGPARHAAVSERFLGGALLALGAGLSYALYAVLTKASLARTAPLPLAAGSFVTAAVILTPALFWTDGPGRQIALGWPWLLYLGIVTTGGAYAAYTIGLREVSASVAGVVTLLEPLTGTALGVIVFGERLGGGGIVGAMILLLAIGILIADQAARETRVSSTTPEPRSGGPPRG